MRRAVGTRWLFFLPTVGTQINQMLYFEVYVSGYARLQNVFASGVKPALGTRLDVVPLQSNLL